MNNNLDQTEKPVFDLEKIGFNEFKKKLAESKYYKAQKRSLFFFKSKKYFWQVNFL